MRKLPLALACAAILGSSNAFAIGMGELTVRSYLNQPLRAEIPLVDVRPGEMEGLRVKLADEPSFERSGYSRSAVSGRIHLQLQNGPKPRIVLGSDRAIRDPALGLVIQIDGPDGSLTRDYSILLDPVGYQPATRQAASALRDEAPVTRPPFAAAVETSPVQALGTLRNGVYGPVLPAETLWSIAQRVKPEGVSLRQTVDALRLSNPRAFSNPASNDTLLRGARLKIPSVNEMMRLAASVQAKPAPSVGSEAAPAEPEKSATEPVKAAEPTSVAASAAPHLAIVQPSMNAGEGEARVASPMVGEVVQSAGAPVPAAILEQYESVKIENERLNERVGALDGQLGRMEGLLDLKELKIQELEKRLKEPSKEPSVTPVAAPEAVKAPAAAEPDADSPSLMGLLTHPVTLAAGGLGALLVALLLGRMRRRRETPSGLEERRISEIESAVPLVAVASEAATAAEAMPAVDAAPVETAAMGSDVDPEHGAIEEADVMVAYGLHDRAIKVLDHAIEGMPDSAALHARRVQAFHDMGSREDFLSAAKAYREKFTAEGDPHWAAICALGAQAYPDAPLFGGDELPHAWAHRPVPEPVAPEMAEWTTQASMAPVQAEPEAGVPERVAPPEALSLPSSLGAYSPEEPSPEPRDLQSLDLPPLDLQSPDLPPLDLQSLDFPPLDLNLPDVTSLGTAVSETGKDEEVADTAEWMKSFDIPAFEAPVEAPVEALAAVTGETLPGIPEAPGFAAFQPGISDEDLMILGIDAASFSAPEPAPVVDLVKETPAPVVDGAFDEPSAKLDIAQAFIDMSDMGSARAVLEEIISTADASSQQRARAMLETLQG